MTTATALPDRISLHQLPRGTRGRIDSTDLPPADAAMLRAMGLRPDAPVRMCRLGRTCIVEVCDSLGGGCRIGLCRSLAQRVVIRRDEGCPVQP